MGDKETLLRGAEGEHRVAEILREMQPQFGYLLINDLLLEFNGTTSQMDHILIDQFGALVIETKCYNALLRGTSEDRYWTACYHNGKTRQMLNPLVQNDGHRHWLGKLLVQNQRDLPEKYIQSLIVFARGETDFLELSGVDPLRVVTPSNLAEFIAARYDFMPNEGQLGPEAQQDLLGFLVAADKSTDEAAMARHLAMCADAKRGRTRKRAVVAQLTPHRKSKAELKWEAKQERKRRELVAARVQMAMGIGLVAALWAAGSLGHCAR